MITIYILIVLLPHLVYTIVRGTTGISQERNTNSNNNINNDDCGITGYYPDSTNNRIPNGEYAFPGQWPWVVALNYNLYEIGFLCTGSILTNRHILTAAKCMAKDKGDIRYMTVALGQFKLRRFNIEGTVNRKVASYKIHPNSDLVILILETPVEFSPFIRPICLWSSSTDIENVVDRTGYVVGWVKHPLYSRRLVSEPRMLRMLIVNRETCLRSYPENHILRTSFTEHTFCGNVGTDLLGENNPCSGDVGSGLVLFDNSTGRYQLRGILSQFIMHRNRDWCNVGKYIIYVDVAKYIPWIQQQISTTYTGPNHVFT